MGRYGIFAKKPGALLCVILSFLLTWYLFGSFAPVWALLAVHIVMIIFALSNAAELMFLGMEDVRKIFTRAEKERVNAIFDSVRSSMELKEAEKRRLDFNCKTSLYIADTASVNAFSIGRRAVIITRGLMNHMDDDQMAGIMAHELGHIANGDTQVNMLITFGTAFYFFIFALIAKGLRFIEAVIGENIIGTLVSIIRWFVEAVITAVSLLWSIFLGHDSRIKEFKADEYAFEIGYGEGLLSALNVFYDIEVSDKKPAIERLQATHPKTAIRIAVLENMIDPEETE